jgi:membrane protease YdiL (CAAX protease family)
MTPRERAWWAAVALGTVPVAWALARAGQGIDVESPLRDVAWLVLLAVAEEAVFRGGVQAALLRLAPLTRRLGPVSAANATASLAFGAAHLWQHPAALAAAVFPVSLLLGLAYERSGGRLVLPAALHAWFNLALYGASALHAAG